MIEALSITQPFRKQLIFLEQSTPALGFTPIYTCYHKANILCSAEKVSNVHSRSMYDHVYTCIHVYWRKTWNEYFFYYHDDGIFTLDSCLFHPILTFFYSRTVYFTVIYSRVYTYFYELLLEMQNECWYRFVLCVFIYICNVSLTSLYKISMEFYVLYFAY